MSWQVVLWGQGAGEQSRHSDHHQRGAAFTHHHWGFWGGHWPLLVFRLQFLRHRLHVGWNLRGRWTIFSFSLSHFCCALVKTPPVTWCLISSVGTGASSSDSEGEQHFEHAAQWVFFLSRTSKASGHPQVWPFISPFSFVKVWEEVFKSSFQSHRFPTRGTFSSLLPHDLWDSSAPALPAVHLPNQSWGPSAGPTTSPPGGLWGSRDLCGPPCRGGDRGPDACACARVWWHNTPGQAGSAHCAHIRGCDSSPGPPTWGTTVLSLNFAFSSSYFAQTPTLFPCLQVQDSRHDNNLQELLNGQPVMAAPVFTKVELPTMHWFSPVWKSLLLILIFFPKVTCSAIKLGSLMFCQTVSSQQLIETILSWHALIFLLIGRGGKSRSASHLFCYWRRFFFSKCWWLSDDFLLLLPAIVHKYLDFLLLTLESYPCYFCF